MILKSWRKTELVWLAFALLVITLSSLNGTWVEFATALTNVMCVILVAKGRVANFYWGLAGVMLYGYTSYVAGYYGNMSLNIFYYVPMQFYGWYMWRKGLTETQVDVAAKRLTFLQVLVSFISLSFMVALYAWFLSIYTDDPSPTIDAFTAVASVLAMWLMVKQYSEQWVLWVLINIASIYLWVLPAIHEAGSLSMVGMWSIFLINSLYGAYKWFIVRTSK